jgi:glycosyltransferase involved in cell wall biosynthesis
VVTIASPLLSGKYIQEALETALAQDYLNPECLLADDCPTYHMGNKGM